jgi:hypothetical protein
MFLFPPAGFWIGATIDLFAAREGQGGVASIPGDCFHNFLEFIFAKSNQVDYPERSTTDLTGCPGDPDIALAGYLGPEKPGSLAWSMNDLGQDLSEMRLICFHDMRSRPESPTFSRK